MKQKQSTITGILFIICTVSGIASVTIIGTPKQNSDLIALFQNEVHFIIGALLLLIMGFACTSIALSIYPVIKEQAPVLAIASVIFRSIEGALFVIASVLYLSMLSLFQSGALTEMSGEVLLDVKYWISSYGAAIAFCLGAVMYYLAFLKTNLVSRWLVLWGLIAALLHLVAIVFVVFGYNPFSPFLLVLNLPIALQEMVFAIWLLVKGYQKSEISNI